MNRKLVIGVSVLTLIPTVMLAAAPTAPANTLPTGPLPSLGGAIGSGVSPIISQTTSTGAEALQLNLEAPMGALSPSSPTGAVSQRSAATTTITNTSANADAYSNAPRQSTQPVQGGSSSSSGQVYTGANLPSRRSRDNRKPGARPGAVRRTGSKAGGNASSRHRNAGGRANLTGAEFRNRGAYRHRSIAAGGSGGWDHQWALEDQEGFWSLEQCGCYVRHGRKSGDASRQVPIWTAAAAEPRLFAGWPWLVLSALLITAGVVMSRRAD